MKQNLTNVESGVSFWGGIIYFPDLLFFLHALHLLIFQYLIALSDF